MTIRPKDEPLDVQILPLKFSPEDEKKRAAAAKELTNLRKTTAWSLNRWPMERRPILTRANVHLPRSYLGRDGEDVRTVYPGQDLNQFVFRHYQRKTEEKGKKMTNYVCADKVSDKRYVFYS